MSTADEKIVLGSGKLYTQEFISSVIPTNEELETDDNLLGLIQGGATLVYKPKFVEVEDDLGLVSKTILTEEAVTLSSGVLTWCGKTLSKVCSTARVTEKAGKRTVKIGGLGQHDGKKYVIRFVHEDKVDGDIRVTIVGSNQAGFTFKFIKDKETVLDAEFTAAPMDNEGTKIIFEEDIPGLPEILTVTSIAGTISGNTKMTISPVLTSGNSYVYKVGTIIAIPLLNDICNAGTGYTVWDGTTDITAITNNEIEIVEIDSTFKAIKAGKTTIVSKA